MVEEAGSWLLCAIEQKSKELQHACEVASFGECSCC